jgi:chromatin segregation and condensation protein Rec8/ScpA/Scc1 (kleisin family)
MEACLVVLRGRPGTEEFAPPNSYRVEVPNLWRIPDAIDRVRNRLVEHPEGGSLTSFLPAIGKEEAARTLKLRAAVASIFAASLELSRQQYLVADQEEKFAEVMLRAVGTPPILQKELDWG